MCKKYQELLFNKRWEEYKQFFQLEIFRYLVMWFSIVPIIAGIIAQLPEPLNIQIGHQVHPVQLTLPFNWQLLWLSSFFFVLALLIYKIYCPNFIHQYNKYSDYAAHNHDPRWLTTQVYDLLEFIGMKQHQKDKFIKRLYDKDYLNEVVDDDENILSHTDPKVESKQTTIRIFYQNKIYEFGMPINSHAEDVERSVFWEVFGSYSATRLWARNTIQVLLLISLILFLVSLLQHIIKGGVFVMHWIGNFFN